MREALATTPLEYASDGKIRVTTTALQETQGLKLAIAMCPDDFKPDVRVSVREATSLERRVSGIMLAALRERVGEEIDLSSKDRRIYEDPKSLRGARASYVEDRVVNGYGLTGFAKRVARHFVRRS